MVYAPPGSGYSRPEDEESFVPDTYEPMMEYPGTMRPGRTVENMPFQDLPIGDGDPDPVPWPHFQQIEWHHQWEPPHPHPIPMEEFIELNGRWATPEMEAAMRVGVRRDVRERKAAAEESKKETIITDDDEDDDDVDLPEEPIALGDGIFGKLGSDADMARTAELSSPSRASDDAGATKTTATDDEEEDFADDDGLDDFLLDLGLDVEVEEEDVAVVAAGTTDTAGGDGDGDAGTGSTLSVADDDDDDLDVDDEGDDLVVGNVVDDNDDDGSLDTVPLEAFDNDEDAESVLDTEDVFDEGGFDFGDDGGDDGFDGGDGDGMW